MWSEVLYAIVAAVVVYAVGSVVLKVIGTRVPLTGASDIKGESWTDDAGPPNAQ